MRIKFEMKGTINAKNLEDALNTLETIQMDYDINNIHLEVQGSSCLDYEPRYDVDIICKKK